MINKFIEQMKKFIINGQKFKLKENDYAVLRQQSININYNDNIEKYLDNEARRELINLVISEFNCEPIILFSIKKTINKNKNEINYSIKIIEIEERNNI
ncbi:MAG: hypothetical protein JXB50_08120 [Spirochaetes bacterium]|nr:hypothetical protein [Spirochaetota bacterium]